VSRKTEGVSQSIVSASCKFESRIKQTKIL